MSVRWQCLHWCCKTPKQWRQTCPKSYYMDPWMATQVAHSGFSKNVRRQTGVTSLQHLNTVRAFVKYNRQTQNPKLPTQIIVILSLVLTIMGKGFRSWWHPILLLRPNTSSIMSKMHWCINFLQVWGQEFSLPTNPDLAGLLGRTYCYFENLHCFEVSGFLISRFLGSLIAAFPISRRQRQQQRRQRKNSQIPTWKQRSKKLQGALAATNYYHKHELQLGGIPLSFK